MVRVLTHDIPDHKIKLKIRQFQVMGKKIQGKLMLISADGILLDMKGKFTIWKPNASCLSYNLVVILLLLSRMKSRSR